MKTYLVIAKRTSYESIEIEAKSNSEARHLACDGQTEYDWKDLSELEWCIDEVEEIEEKV